MPPRKRVAAPSTPSFPLPPPNSSHPCASQIPHALSSSRAHSASYHSFLTSPYLPTTAPPPKKKGAKLAPTLPPLVEAPIEAEVLQRKVLSWYDRVKEGRGMPWRKEVDLGGLNKAERSQRGYEVWVSEIMLQQTQVATVIAYWLRWMIKFPTLLALSQADIEEVNAVWAGLGYYSRASRLLAGAKTVVRDFGGRMPETASELEKVDGIGPYSAGAISSIAFGKRAAMVDGNVTRVLSRLTAFHASATAKASTNFIWALADVLVPSPSASLAAGGHNKPGAWNQALMELGATVCTPKNPSCGECPLSDECLGFAEVRAGKEKKVEDIEDLCDLCGEMGEEARGMGVTRYPMAKERKKAREEETAVCVLEWESSEGGPRKVLLLKRPEKGLLAGLFEFPAVDLPTDSDSTPSSRSKVLHKLLNALLVSPIPSPSSPSGILKSTSDLSSITQVYSHQIRLYHILRVVLSSPSLPELATSNKAQKAGESVVGRGKWVDEASVAGANIGGAVGKVWEVRMGGGVGPGPKKRKAPVKKVVRKESESEEEAQEISSSEEDKVVVKRKKRVIVISSDEDD